MELDINGAKILFTLPIDLPVLGPLRISETMVVSWIVMILITGFCIWLTHDLKEENISKRQALAEMLVEMANKFVVGNMGEKFRYMIPFVAATAGKYEAYKQDCHVVPTSYGGDTSGYQILFTVKYVGERVKGKFDITSGSFTADSE